MQQIRKRTNAVDIFDVEKIKRNLAVVCHNYPNISIDLIINKVLSKLPENLTTIKLNELLMTTMYDFQILCPDYEKAALKYYLNSIYKITPETFSESSYLAYSYKIINEKHWQFIHKHQKELNAMIDQSRDEIFTYLGLNLLVKQNYLIMARDKLFDRPQYMFMRVAVGLWAFYGTERDALEKIKQYYELFSRQIYTHATPTVYNACQTQQFNSCFLFQVEDSIEGIMRGATQASIISKYSGGVGFGYSSVRGANSQITGVNGKSKGVVNQLKLYSACAVCWDQGGKRKGSFAVYLEPHHPDIEEFIVMRDTNLRNAEMHLNTGLWISDLFIERVEKKEKWSLFSSNTAPGLEDVYGDEYKALYERYESEGRAVKTISAWDLFELIAKSVAETSSPYICFKDHVNRKSNQKNIGTIKCSNLCTEIMEWSSADSIATCTLCSINLKKFVRADKTYDFEQLHETAKLCTYALNRVIDVSMYPLKECEKNAYDYRPIGIGVQGLANAFYELRLAYDSPEAEKLDVEIFETIYHGALEASMELAQKNGPYSAFKGSPASEGILQYHLWGKKNNNGRWNWEMISNLIKLHGLRNSLVTALMPTVSTSKFLGNCDSFEPFFSNANTISGLSGKVSVFNKYLMEHLNELGLWDEKMRSELILNEGSVQNIERIPKEIRAIYKTVFEIKQSYLIERNASRSIYVDQAASFNIFSSDNTSNAIKAIILKTHRAGLKTGIYYFHAKTAATAIKNVEVEKKIKKCTDEVCTACSS